MSNLELDVLRKRLLASSLLINLNNEQINKIINYYYVSKKSFSEAVTELGNVMNNKESILDFMGRIDSFTLKNDKKLSDVEKNTKKELNLEDVSDFYQNGKSYIKMRYNDNIYKIIENSTNLTSMQIFELIKSKMINSIDLIDKNTATQIFDSLIKDSIEVQMESFDEVSNDRLKTQYDANELAKLEYVRNMFPEKKVIGSPKDNIYILFQKGFEDKTVKLEQINGKYEIVSFSETKYDKDSNEKTTNDSTPETNTSLNNEPIEYETNSEILTPPVKEKQKILVLKNDNAAFVNSLLIAYLVISSVGILFILMLPYIFK